MAEKLNIQPEQGKAEQEAPAERHEKREHHSAKSHETAQHEQQDKLKASRESVEHYAKSSEDLGRFDAGSERSDAHVPPPTRELQAMARDRLLRSIRRKLPAPQRALSKFVHAKPVEVVSAASEKTIARPYGLLGGGLSAFIGSVLTFYMAKHYGFKYNLFLFFTFFVAGYIIATVIEAIVRLTQRSR